MTYERQTHDLRVTVTGSVRVRVRVRFAVRVSVRAYLLSYHLYIRFAGCMHHVQFTFSFSLRVS